MKELIKSLAGRLYSYLGGDLCELTRRANKLLTVQHPFVDEPYGAEREAFLRGMVTLSESKDLDWLLQQISEDQKRLSFEEAKNLGMLDWGRATMNGMMLLKDRLRAYRAEYEELTKRQEAFDPHRPI